MSQIDPIIGSVGSFLSNHKKNIDTIFNSDKMYCVKLGDLTKDVLDQLRARSYTLLSAYYKDYYGDGFCEEAFVLYEQDEAHALALCAVVDNQITLPEGGCQIILLKDLPEKQRKKLYQEVMDHLWRMAQNRGCRSVVIKDTLSDNALSMLGQKLFNQKFCARVTFEMNIGYEHFQPPPFFKSLRSSYKSLVRWGQKNLSLSYVNKDNPCLDSFLQVKAFHKKISGRTTRSDATWHDQYEMLKAGFGEALLAHYQGDLVAAALFVDVYQTSIYCTGVYERDLFHYGLSHALLFEGICRSYQRGNATSFSLGYFDTDIKDPKWYDIQFFKKGFCRTLHPTIFWSKEVS